MHRNYICDNCLLLDCLCLLPLYWHHRISKVSRKVNEKYFEHKHNYTFRYKIQPEKNVPLDMSKLWKVTKHVLVNQVWMLWLGCNITSLTVSLLTDCSWNSRRNVELRSLEQPQLRVEHARVTRPGHVPGTRVCLHDVSWLLVLLRSQVQ